MKRSILPLLLLCLLALCLCGTAVGCDEELAPTGYPSGEVQRPFLYYHDTLYVYVDTLLEPTQLPLDPVQIGVIETVDNKNMPETDFAASRMDVGTKLYAAKHEAENPKSIYADVIWGEAGQKLMLFEICTEY